ncbi:MAG: UDP-2,4-diacetamido-2,4,6-trideoxy-beta-L-altropyranose hydrolase [Gammaproteobacteria bacterium]|nr:UDP-2,4-diacetamido-2,4,6-trideoxy-beta-L-altropyranose hydrolase [Gammaproteobacteria bacterium]MBU1624022.1 UDP-2,4-diacetamido-2,4,6-trideoxy-beta-L-altropyranose hydrolase [Gammaproteobacteria bacterium]MBU1981750.1 UDP-2,4-diacetamido-2,4,6-trideoxy-beta-L-altropyranose hydrolase [Gammaproteobacteria bacterium]
MNVAFRTDASAQIGTGHFMRCMTLAGALQRRGASISFISRKLPGYLHEMLKEKGMEYVALDACSAPFPADELAHASWLGASQTQDAIATVKASAGRIWDWLIVDHYALDSRWESMLCDVAKKLLVIDDIADRQHQCDVLLDQNLFSDMDRRYSGKVPANGRILLGPGYALLRDEFKNLHGQVSMRTGTGRRVLVFFGGADKEDCTGRAIEALKGIGDLEVDVVIGALHPFREQIEMECARHGYVCHVQTDRMAELMAIADLAIGAGGSASWERCCMGLPTVLVALADNQVDIAKALDEFGASIYVGTLKVADVSALRSVITELLRTQEKLAAMSEKAYSLVDGLGAERVCQVMEA